MLTLREKAFPTNDPRLWLPSWPILAALARSRGARVMTSFSSERSSRPATLHLLAGRCTRRWHRDLL